jgi:hypothetical protein
LQKQKTSKSAGDFEVFRRVAVNLSYPTRTRTELSKPLSGQGFQKQATLLAAESGAVDARGIQERCNGGKNSDLGLRLLIGVWDELPDSVRNRILKLADESLAAVR